MPVQAIEMNASLRPGYAAKQKPQGFAHFC
jgi:hypothetical protein